VLFRSGNIKAAGVGITLTAASDVLFLEFPWTPGDLEQAADRCHRIGQLNSVTVYYMVANDTIEEDIVEILQSKAAVIGQAMDGAADFMGVNILNELARRLALKMGLNGLVNDNKSLT
jgi:SWI/SNF-related matrix-associated actin-dependent regulator 1 of chromatin subfamily A